MSELFPTEVPELPQKKKKGGYHAKDGKFTNKETAVFAEKDREIKRLTTVSEFYKRQCKRLVRELNEEIEKRKQLESKTNVQTNIQQEKLSIAG